jgi:hypothetical protein
MPVKESLYEFEAMARYNPIVTPISGAGPTDICVVPLLSPPSLFMLSRNVQEPHCKG